MMYIFFLTNVDLIRLVKDIGYLLGFLAYPISFSISDSKDILAIVPKLCMKFGFRS